MTEHPNSIFDTFVSQLRHDLPRLEARVETYERLAAPRMNPFLVMRTNENAVNRFIADLLDPRGAHGQGTLFLNAVLDAVGLNGMDFQTHGNVTTEASTQANRRIDIVIEGHDWIVGIENKFDAIQQIEQLDDYWSYLKSKVSNPERARLIFLSNQEAQARPETCYHQITYARGTAHPCFPEILIATLSHIEAERTRSILQDFLTYIDLDRRSETMADSQGREYVRYLEKPWAKRIGSFGDHDRVMAKAVAMAMQLGEDGFQRLCIDRIADAIVERLSPLQVLVTDKQASLHSIMAGGNDSWTLRNATWPEHCYLALSTNNGPFRSIFYGVRALDPAKLSEVRKASANGWGSPCQQRDVVEIALKSAGQTSKSYAWWPFYKDYKNVPDGSTDWTARELSRMVLAADGEVEKHISVQSMIDHMVAIAEALNNC